jgi:GNAT superfamily N-acetyltransferase
LILRGLEQRWGSLDPSCNPDLNDIGSTYNNAIFLVAVMDRQLVATGGLVPLDDHVGQIVRMSVDAAFRRKGIGRRMFDRLCEEARNRGMQRLQLETTAAWDDAVEFYVRCGCVKTEVLDEDQHFTFDLRA